jgi:catechol 2,3-dioxygenase-like lactoylglutathione lyase family enzyme
MVDMKLELVAIPVSDVDRAKAFYTDKAGFSADHDNTVSDEMGSNQRRLSRRFYSTLLCPSATPLNCSYALRGAISGYHRPLCVRGRRVPRARNPRTGTDGEGRGGVLTVRRSGMPTVLRQRLAADLPPQAPGIAFTARAGLGLGRPESVSDSVVGRVGPSGVGAVAAGPQEHGVAFADNVLDVDFKVGHCRAEHLEQCHEPIEPGDIVDITALVHDSVLCPVLREPREVPGVDQVDPVGGGALIRRDGSRAGLPVALTRRSG